MSCNLLIVDDSPILRAAIKKTAVHAGVDPEKIREAGHGRAALDVLDDAWIDLVLLDINMPVMDGEEFLGELRKHPDFSTLPVIIVSTESNKERLERLRKLGVVGTLRKPFEPEQLHSMIKHLLGVQL